METMKITSSALNFPPDDELTALGQFASPSRLECSSGGMDGREMPSTTWETRREERGDDDDDVCVRVCVCVCVCVCARAEVSTVRAGL
jgi:hypothetical protein